MGGGGGRGGRGATIGIGIGAMGSGANTGESVPVGPLRGLVCRVGVGNAEVVMGENVGNGATPGGGGGSSPAPLIVPVTASPGNGEPSVLVVGDMIDNPLVAGALGGTSKASDPASRTTPEANRLGDTFASAAVRKPSGDTKLTSLATSGLKSVPLRWLPVPAIRRL